MLGVLLELCGNLEDVSTSLVLDVVDCTGKKVKGQVILLTIQHHDRSDSQGLYLQRVPKKLTNNKHLTRIECCGPKFSHEHDVGAFDPA